MFSFRSIRFRSEKNQSEAKPHCQNQESRRQGGVKILSETMIFAREAELRAQIVAANEELADLAAAKRLLARMSDKTEVAVDRTGTTPHVLLSSLDPKSTAGRAVGLTATLISILRESPTPWVTAKDLQNSLSARLERAVPMSSISPKLWELKKKKIVNRDDMLVALAERVASSPPSKGGFSAIGQLFGRGDEPNPLEGLS